MHMICRCRCSVFVRLLTFSKKYISKAGSNFMCSFNGQEDRLHKVIGLIGLELWLIAMATYCSHRLIIGKTLIKIFSLKP